MVVATQSVTLREGHIGESIAVGVLRLARKSFAGGITGTEIKKAYPELSDDTVYGIVKELQSRSYVRLHRLHTPDNPRCEIAQRGIEAIESIDFLDNVSKMFN